MGHDITRRDFLNGAALTVAAGLTPLEQLQAQSAAPRHAPYPPALAGLRGSTDDSYGVIHARRPRGQHATTSTSSKRRRPTTSSSSAPASPG